MTDLASKSETEGESGAPESVDAAATTVIASDTAAPLEWAPAEPAKRSRKKLWLWIGVPAALVLAGVIIVKLGEPATDAVAEQFVEPVPVEPLPEVRLSDEEGASTAA